MAGENDDKDDNDKNQQSADNKTEEADKQPPASPTADAGSDDSEGDSRYAIDSNGDLIEQRSDRNSDDQGEGSDDDDDRPQRRRRSHSERNRIRRERENTLKAELAQRDAIIANLAKQVNGIHRYNLGNTVGNIENNMRNLQTAYQQAAARYKAAIESGNGEEAVAAQSAMISADNNYKQYYAQRDALLKAQQEGVREEPAARRERAEDDGPPVTRLVERHMNRFLEDHPWFDLKGKDEDSQIVHALDAKLNREGYDPETREFWDELVKRTREELPERFDRRRRENRDDDYDDEPPPRREPRRGAPPTRGASRGGPMGGNTYTLTAAQYKAIREAGYDGNDEESKKARVSIINEWKQRDAERRRENRR